MDEKSGPKLLDLMTPKKEKEFMGGRKNGGCCVVSDEKKLELRLGLPCEEDYRSNNKNYSRERKDSLLSLNYSYSNGGGGTGCGEEYKPHHHYHQQQQHHHPWSGTSCCSVYQNQQQQQQLQQQQQQQKQQQYLNNGKPQQLSVMGKDASQACCTRIAELQSSEKKAFSPPSANTAVPNTSQKRTAPAPVVGWPPIRSFRKNLASSSTAKGVPESLIPSKPVSEKKPATDSSNKGLFVKINMDGVPIGRKVDLHAYNCYDNLSSAVDTLFRGLLAAQRDSSAGGIDNKQEEQKPITGLLDGTGEYTLVYEDNEGDRMLVGDVPWHMFVSTVKRLRVLKSSDLPTLSRNGSKAGKMMAESTPK